MTVIFERNLFSTGNTNAAFSDKQDEQLFRDLKFEEEEGHGR